MIKLDREKYLKILRTNGYSAALTQLHLDKNEMEIETFEGQEGYQREMWNYLQEVRDFSLELWDLSSREVDLTKH